MLTAPSPGHLSAVRRVIQISLARHLHQTLWCRAFARCPASLERHLVGRIADDVEHDLLYGGES